MSETKEMEKDRFYLELMSKISEMTASSTTLDTLLQVILDLTRDCLRVGRCSLMLIDKETERLKVKVASGIPKELWDKIVVKVGEGISGYVAKTGTPLWTGNIESDTRFNKKNEPKYTTKSFLCVPLKVPDRIIGVINASNKTDGTVFTEDDLNLFIVVAQHSAFAIENAKLFSLTQNMKNYLESVIDNIPAVILTLDNKKRVVLHSKIREKVLKVPEDEIDNRFYKDILNDKMIEVVDNLIDALEKTGVSQYCEIDLTTSIAEKPIPIGVSASYLHGAKNEVLGLLLIFRNVTLNREVSKLKHLEDVRSNFLSMISHELRTPITSVKGALSLLNSMKDENADAQTNELFDIVNRNLDRLVMLINDLLDVTEIANNSLKLNKKKSSINEIVQIAVKKLIGEAEKKCVAIEEEFGEDLPELEIDVERFEHVIMHLIHNAIKFSPKNGKVDVMTYQDNGKICVSIKDSGKGIKASNISKIYDLFFQEDSSKTRRYGGAGIGMHIVRKIVDLHNGEIIVQNNDKEPGLTVMIKLPIELNP